MIRAILDHPNGFYPKWPQVIEAETQERFDRQVKRSRAGVKARHGAEGAARLTVTLITGTQDISGEYREAE